MYQTLLIGNIFPILTIKIFIIVRNSCVKIKNVNFKDIVDAIGNCVKYSINIQTNMVMFVVLPKTFMF